MNRTKRFFGSRFFLSAIAIILQFVQILGSIVFLCDYYLPITILARALSTVVLLYLLNRDEIPELKLPWMIILFLFPIVGAAVFLLLSSNEASKKQFKRYENAALELEPYHPEDGGIQALREQNEEAFVQANYIWNATSMPAGNISDITYYPLGERFFDALIPDLKKAEHFILMEYFIVQEGLMWNTIHEILREKAASGVEVYVMYDDFGCMKTLPEHYYRQLREEGIHCVPSNKFRPILSHIHNNRDHRKITVIDGRIGYTGGINLADEYINAFKKYGHWKDSAVRITGEAVHNLTMLFLSIWNMQGDCYMDPEQYLQKDILGCNGSCAVIPFGDGPSPIYRETIAKNVYLNIIHGAKRYLYITTPYLICDHEILSALRIAAKKGVDVRLITPHIPDKKAIHWMTRSNYPMLLKEGVRIYEYTPGFIHAKNFICDDQFAVCGTINLDYRSLVHHFECGVWMYQADCIRDMKDDFLLTSLVSQEISLSESRLRGWERLVTEVMKVFSPLL